MLAVQIITISFVFHSRFTILHVVAELRLGINVQCMFQLSFAWKLMASACSLALDFVEVFQ